MKTSNTNHPLPFYLWLPCLLLLLCSSLAVAQTMVLDEPKIMSLIGEHGQARVIVSFKVEDFKQLSSASSAFTKPTVEGLSAAQGNPDAMLTEAIGNTADAIIRGLPANSYTFKKSFPYTPAMVLEIDKTALEALKANAGVVSIQEDELSEAIPVIDSTNEPSGEIDQPLLNDSTPLIGASSVWARGVTGAGTYVAVLDTGVLSSHEMFGGKKFVEACFSTTYAPELSYTVCPNGQQSQIGTGAAAPTAGDHGTHVAGIAAGNNKSPNPGEPLKGVAYEADIIAIQVFSKFYSSDVCGSTVPCYLTWNSDQLSALNHVYSLRNSYTIGAVNMSIGGGSNVTYCDSDLRKSIIDQLRQAKIATAIATGNDGYCGATSTPACISSAVSVGATTKSDQEALYNNFSQTIQDLFAPGSYIYSAGINSTTSYKSKSGTSMATPHVAGAFALYRQADPAASVSEMENKFKSTGKIIPSLCISNGGQKPRISLSTAIPELPSEGKSINSTYLLLLKSP